MYANCVMRYEAYVTSTFPDSGIERRHVLRAEPRGLVHFELARVHRRAVLYEMSAESLRDVLHPSARRLDGAVVLLGGDRKLSLALPYDALSVRHGLDGAHVRRETRTGVSEALSGGVDADRVRDGRELLRSEERRVGKE